MEGRIRFPLKKWESLNILTKNAWNLHEMSQKTYMRPKLFNQAKIFAENEGL